MESEPGDDGLRNAYLSAWELREAQKYEQWVSGSRDPLSTDTRTSLSKGEDRAGLRKVVRICGSLACPAQELGWLGKFGLIRSFSTFYESVCVHTFIKDKIHEIMNKL